MGNIARTVNRNIIPKLDPFEEKKANAIEKEKE